MLIKIIRTGMLKIKVIKTKPLVWLVFKGGWSVNF